MKEVIRVKAEDKGLNKCFRDRLRKKHLTIEDMIQGEMAEFGFSLLIGERKMRRKKPKNLSKLWARPREKVLVLLYTENDVSMRGTHNSISEM